MVADFLGAVGTHNDTDTYSDIASTDTIENPAPSRQDTRNLAGVAVPQTSSP